jgi:hypothetical protein
VILSLSPEFSGFSVHIHTYLVRPKTRADPGIKLCPPGERAWAAAGAPPPRGEAPMMGRLGLTWLPCPPHSPQ